MPDGHNVTAVRNNSGIPRDLMDTRLKVLFGNIRNDGTLCIRDGDFDITGFIASRAIGKNKEDFDAYITNQNEKRKDSFNYPLLCGIILIVLAGISALAV